MADALGDGMTNRTEKNRKAPSQKALRAALYAILAARDTLERSGDVTADTKVVDTLAHQIAARVLMHMHSKPNAGITPEDVEWAKGEVLRACLMVGLPYWREQTPTEKRQ
jgi:hypothetical protein